MNIIEKAVEKLEAEVDDLLREEREALEAKKIAVPANEQEMAPPSSHGGMKTSTSDSVMPSAVPARGPALGDTATAVATPAAGGGGPADGTTRATSEHVDLDLAALGAAGFVTPDRDQGLVAEEFRIIKRPLLAKATPGGREHVANGNNIIVTSSLPGEGKTFNALNLAFSIAMEVNRTVLLVDADVAKSDVSRILGLGGRRGLSDYLLGEEKDLSKLLVRTNMDSLSVLPSGPRHPRITELVASDQMRHLVAELASRYPDRVIIFDSPPLMATSGAGVLANLMGQVVLVVEAVRTPQSALREALRRLGDAPSVSVVLNKQREGARGSYGYRDHDYGYGYGYGHGHGYGPESGDSAKPG